MRCTGARYNVQITFIQRLELLKLPPMKFIQQNEELAKARTPYKCESVLFWVQSRTVLAACASVARDCRDNPFRRYPSNAMVAQIANNQVPKPIYDDSVRLIEAGDVTLAVSKASFGSARNYAGFTCRRPPVLRDHIYVQQEQAVDKRTTCASLCG